MLKNLMTRKQAEILKRSRENDWFMMINHGAVRAGKTILDNDLFIFELLRVKDNAKKEGVDQPMYILAGYSAESINNNVLSEISNRYGVEFHFNKFGGFKLFGVTIVTVSTQSIRGLGAVRGMTAYGAYINEASLANHEVFDEIIKRCSGAGARVILDTNPDYPQHWLKTDYIDKADGKHIIENHFTLWDNTFLSQRYIDNVIATTPTGTFTERGIYGRWVIGEGAIYSDFNQQEQVYEDKPLSDYSRFFVGLDWGYKHYGVIEVFGVEKKENDEEAFYLIEEHAHQEWDFGEWLDVGKDIQNRYGKRIPFYCDSARPEYVDGFYYAGINAMNADKRVLSGITQVATLIKNKQLFVHSSAKRWLTEVNTYVWNKSGDAPEKMDDDAMDATRYAIYTDLKIRTDGFTG